MANQMVYFSDICFPPGALLKQRSEVLFPLYIYIWVFPKIGGNPPKMDGENNGKPY